MNNSLVTIHITEKEDEKLWKLLNNQLDEIIFNKSEQKEKEIFKFLMIENCLLESFVRRNEYVPFNQVYLKKVNENFKLTIDFFLKKKLKTNYSVFKQTIDFYNVYFSVIPSCKGVFDVNFNI